MSTPQSELLSVRHELDHLRRRYTLNVLELANELDDLTQRIIRLETNLSSNDRPTNSVGPTPSPRPSEVLRAPAGGFGGPSSRDTD